MHKPDVVRDNHKSSRIFMALLVVMMTIIALTHDKPHEDGAAKWPETNSLRNSQE